MLVTSDLIYSCIFSRDSAPGQKECEDAIEKVNRSIRDLDQASLAAISSSLPQRHERSLRVSLNSPGIFGDKIRWELIDLS